MTSFTSDYISCRMRGLGDASVVSMATAEEVHTQIKKKKTSSSSDYNNIWTDYVL